jgi:hypothetical protein
MEKEINRAERKPVLTRFIFSFGRQDGKILNLTGTKDIKE